MGIGLFESNKLIGFIFFGKDTEIITQIFKKNFVYIFYSFFLYFIKLKFKKVLNYFDVLIYLILSNFKKRKYKNINDIEKFGYNMMGDVLYLPSKLNKIEEK